MKISIILGHPYPGSFNHAIAATVIDALNENNHQFFYHDLYREGFNPLITGPELVSDNSDDPLVMKHCDEIRGADGIIIIHPNWWGQPPAILKGWVDRVLRNGVAYTFPEGDSGGGLPVGLLKAKTAIVLNTSNTPEERELTVFGDPLELVWKKCIFEFCGVPGFYRKMFRVVADSTPEERQGWLGEVNGIIVQHFSKD